MHSFQQLKGAVVSKVKKLKAKLLRRSEKSAEPQKPVIGAPTNMRRTEMTLGTDVEGNTILVQNAREDAHAMHTAMKAEQAAAGFTSAGK